MDDMGHITRKPYLSYDAVSRSDIMPCIIMDKPLVVYIFSNIKSCVHITNS